MEIMGGHLHTVLIADSFPGLDTKQDILGFPILLADIMYIIGSYQR